MYARVQQLEERVASLEAICTDQHTELLQLRSKVTDLEQEVEDLKPGSELGLSPLTIDYLQLIGASDAYDLEGYINSLQVLLEDLQVQFSWGLSADGDKDKIELKLQQTSDWLDNNPDAERAPKSFQLWELEEVVNPIMMKVVFLAARNEEWQMNAIRDYCIAMHMALNDDAMRNALEIDDKHKLQQSLEETKHWFRITEQPGEYEMKTKRRVLDVVVKPILMKLCQTGDEMIFRRSRSRSR